ncbi:MAG: hypothetical protein NZM94_04715, partial [Roseiflexus sp.]|nr:hypothetical protein [Roseiflexus sp.]
RDLDGDGARDANEPGIGGVTITAYDPSGAVAGITVSFATLCLGPGNPVPACTALSTPALGSYTLNAGGTGPYRIEFSNWPSYLSPAAQGASNDTSIQFVPDGDSSNINFALHSPAEYCQENPRVSVTCMQPGASASNANPTIYTFNYTDSSTAPPPQTQTTAAQTGAIWGLAYQRSTNSLFVAAYTKRAAAFGPGSGAPTSDGTGTIYRVTANGLPDGAPFIDLDDVFGPATTGANPHTDLDPFNGNGDFDSGAYAAVGRISLGDLDIAEDDNTLWVVNLANRSLYSIAIDTRTVVARGVVPDPGCVRGVGRPFGLGIRDGLIYVGGVCTAENGGTAADLLAYVYTYNPAASAFSAAPVLQFPLNYPRGCADIFASGYPSPPFPEAGCLPAEWQPWQNTLPAGPYDSGFGGFPQPMLTDIAFDGNAMILAFRDRFADQIGSNDPGPSESPPGGTNLYAVPAGDILRASPNSIGGWTIESNSQSVPPGLFGPTAGAGNAQGPGGGEFYFGDSLPGTHDELVLGGIAQGARFGEVIAVAFDPTTADNLFTAGAIQLSNTTGARVRGYQITGPNASFGKANGLGDLELLCDQAPIEIGNRVWLDVNRNGVQDPGEPPIPGVRVELWRNGTRIGVAVTDAEGTYYFRSGRDPVDANLEDNIIHDGGIGIRTRTGTPGGASEYEVRIPNIAGPDRQPALNNLTPTFANSDSSPNGDSRDSDGIIVGNNVVYVIPYDNHAAAGSNNHTYDFGFFEGVPTAIVLEYFTAVWEGDTLTVRWATVVELNTAGFRLLRSATGRIDDAVMVTPALIRARGSPGSGAAYEWRDPTAQPEIAYTYWMEEIETTGRVNRYGPAMARVQATSPPYRVMIPMIVR